MRLTGALFLLIIFFVGVAFAVLNSSPVVFDYYLGRLELSLATLVVSAFVLGLLSAAIAAALLLIPCRAHLRRVRQQLMTSKDELHNLRNRSFLQDH